MLPLPMSSYGKALEALGRLEFNTLFAHVVLNGTLGGKVFTNCPEHPTTFLIAHPYGMSLLLGDIQNEEFNLALVDYLSNTSGSRKTLEWLQVHPTAWRDTIAGLLGDDLSMKPGALYIPSRAVDDPARVIEYTRVNFKFNPARYRAFADCHSPNRIQIIGTNESIFSSMPGQVIPRYFWRDPEHFMRDGIGFTIMVKGQPASTAFCAFKVGDQLELGIETATEFRGRGLAVPACKALIDYCLENEYEPIWSCRLENVGSYNLAIKMGFEPTLFLPYYRLAYSPK